MYVFQVENIELKLLDKAMLLSSDISDPDQLGERVFTRMKTITE